MPCQTVSVGLHTCQMRVAATGSITNAHMMPIPLLKVVLSVLHSDSRHASRLEFECAPTCFRCTCICAVQRRLRLQLPRTTRLHRRRHWHRHGCVPLARRARQLATVLMLALPTVVLENVNVQAPPHLRPAIVHERSRCPTTIYQEPR
jgi:hypothetical protein